jgi:hypothetical protein
VGLRFYRRVSILPGMRLNVGAAAINESIRRRYKLRKRT